MINTDAYEHILEHPNLATYECVVIAKEAIAEVKRLREQLDRVTKQCGALWSITNNWSMCEDDYTMHDQYENLDERYAWADWGIILKELYTYTEEDGWLRNEELEGD